MKGMINRLSRIFSTIAIEENGVATVVVVGLLLVLTLMAITTIAIANQNLTSSTETRQYTRSLNLAEAGLDRLLWDLRANGIGDIDTSFTLTSAELGQEGTAEVRVLEGGGFFVKAISVGNYRGKRQAVESVLFSTNIWEMNFAGGTQQSVQTGASGITGNAEFIGPLFVRGNFPVGGNTSLTIGPLFVVGGSVIKTSAGGNLGTETTHIAAYISGAPPVKDKKGDEIPPSQWVKTGIYFNPFHDWAPEIILPALDGTKLNLYRSRAENESINESYWIEGVLTNENDIAYSAAPPRSFYPLKAVFPALGSGRYKVFDDNGDNAALGQGGFNLSLTEDTTSFGLFDANGNGTIDSTDTVKWEFAWYNPNKKPAGVDLGSTPTLYVNSNASSLNECEDAIFIDGDLTIGESGDNFTYRGRGTLIVNGDINLYARLVAADFPTVNALGLVSANDIYFWAQSPNDDIEDAQGAFYALGNVYFKSNYFKFKGTVIGGQFICDQKPKLEVDPNLPARLPPSLPGHPEDPTEGGYLTAITSWREIKPPW